MLESSLETQKNEFNVLIKMSPHKNSRMNQVFVLKNLEVFSK